MSQKYALRAIITWRRNRRKMIAGSTLTLNDTDATVTDGYYNDSRLLDSFTDNDDLFDFEDDNLVDF